MKKIISYDINKDEVTGRSHKSPLTKSTSSTQENSSNINLTMDLSKINNSNGSIISSSTSPINLHKVNSPISPGMIQRRSNNILSLSKRSQKTSPCSSKHSSPATTVSSSSPSSLSSSSPIITSPSSTLSNFSSSYPISPNKKQINNQRKRYFCNSGGLMSQVLCLIYITLAFYILTFVYVQKSIASSSTASTTTESLNNEQLMNAATSNKERSVRTSGASYVTHASNNKESKSSLLHIASLSSYSGKNVKEENIVQDFFFPKQEKTQNFEKSGIHYYPRIISNYNVERDTSKKSFFVQDPLTYVTPGEERPEQPDPPRHPRNDKCVPMVPWQTDSKPNCNSMHELDLLSASSNAEYSLQGRKEESSVVYLGQGWFRSAWKADVRMQNNYVQEDEEKQKERVVLKTLRYEREFLDEYFDLHRRDAMAMERLTGSPYVVDIYSFCGQSTINEFAFETVERVARKMRDIDSKNLYKLYMATSAALGVADVHEIDYDENNATLVHYDINPRNVAVTKDGEIKLNDFNVAEFIYWDKEKGERCHFTGRLHEPWWRAPEEMDFSKVTLEEDEDANTLFEHVPGNDTSNVLLDETVDIYSLGNLLYRIITGRAPRGKSIASRMDLVRNQVARGYPPGLPTRYFDEDNPIYTALRHAMRRCYQKKREDRWRARDIAKDLLETLNELVDEKMKLLKLQEERENNAVFGNQGISLKDNLGEIKVTAPKSKFKKIDKNEKIIEFGREV